MPDLNTVSTRLTKQVHGREMQATCFVCAESLCGISGGPQLMLQMPW